MNSPRFQGTLNYLYAHWPEYAAVYGSLILALVFMGISAQRGWFGYIPLTFALILILLYFLLASLWAAHWQFDRDGLRPHQVLFEMARLRPTDHFVYIDVGLRRRPLSLANQLTTGHLTIIDIYNPQWTPSRALARWRSRMRPPTADPRLTWHVGNFNLLPLPDSSTSVIILCQIASELWQDGDRVTLLSEIKRVLTPDGRLYIAEKVRSQTTWLTTGPAALTTPTADYWRQILRESGFHVRQEKNLGGGLIRCFTNAKQTASQIQQLAFNLDLGE
ncbi:MAG: class I SAM-dependent methyltransferase [Ardenticatenaceae bacterium]|nr:class I SAM-dependent methyltransferase [Ardenticatenaceae bacterium]